MSATRASIGFIKVEGRLEPEAIAGSIANDVHRRIGEFLVLSSQWLADSGRPLTEVQRVDIESTASRIFDGIERDVLEAIMDDVRRVAVAP